MEVLLGQIEIRPGDVARNVETVAATLDRHPGAELAVFPELAICGYDVRRAAQLALTADSSALQEIRAAAAANRTAVMIGFAEQIGDHEVANAVACIDADGRWAGCYRKTNLFGEGERGAFQPGRELLVVELAGVRVAPLICFDMEFPEPARAAARAGAELLVTAAANMSPYGPDHELAAAARALDNRLPHVYVNRVGHEAGLRFVGGSTAIDRNGSPVVHLDDRPRDAVCGLDVGARLDQDVDYLQQLPADLPVRTIIAPVSEGTTT